MNAHWSFSRAVAAVLLVAVFLATASVGAAEARELEGRHYAACALGMLTVGNMLCGFGPVACVLGVVGGCILGASSQ